jgi:hypothetical protein
MGEVPCSARDDQNGRGPPALQKLAHLLPMLNAYAVVDRCFQSSAIAAGL